MAPPTSSSVPSFGVLSQRSEQARVRLFCGVLIMLMGLAMLRRLAGGVVMQSPVFWWTEGLLFAGLLFELWVLRCISAANRAGRLLGTAFWTVSNLMDLAMALSLLIMLHLMSPRGEVAALSAPALLILPLIVMLSILRLKPKFALIAGLIGAGAHATLALRAHRISGEDPSTLPVYLSYSAVLAITGVAGALVARHVRGYVEAAVSEGKALAAAREEIGRVDRDLSMAREIQRGLLPQTEPAMEGFDIAGMSRAADQTGGDYYDWQPLPDGRLAVVLADVSGHGIAPALVMAVCRAYARASLPLMDEPGALLGRINTLVHDDVRGGRFVTLALAIVDAKRSRVDLISAGHGPCFLLHSDTGEVEQFGGDGVPLGILADETYGSARTIEMKPGDVLLLVTDGFFEWQRAGDGEQYGTDRLADLLRRVGNESGESILSQLDVSVQSFANGSKQADDVTGVVIKRARA